METYVSTKILIFCTISWIDLVNRQINKDLGNTQFRVPSEEALQQAFYVSIGFS